MPASKQLPGETPQEKDTHLVQALEATEEFLRCERIEIALDDSSPC